MLRHDDEVELTFDNTEHFVLQVKSQDILVLPPPHGQHVPCLVAPPIAFNDEVCAR